MILQTSKVSRKRRDDAGSILAMSPTFQSAWFSSYLMIPLKDSLHFFLTTDSAPCCQTLQRRFTFQKTSNFSFVPTSR